ncbi:MAG: O-antigen ligase family protein [Candidatus Omnitrophica bacterium]|nr:O-antigen ligase family protein [Candidatus Omnitrophota bacterium]
MEGGLYFSLFLSTLLFGAGFVGGYTLLEGWVLLLGASLIFYCTISGSRVFPQRIHPAFLLLGIWAIFLCFQLLPLPVWLVKILSLHRIELAQMFGSLGSSDLKFVPLSLGTYSLWVEVGKSLSYVALFFISYALVRDKNGIRRLSFAVVLIGLFLSLIGLFFFRFSPGKVYGLFHFEQAASFTPYLNKNHFANYLVMTLPVTLGFMVLLADRSSLPMRDTLRSKFLWLTSKEATGFLVVTCCFVIQFAALLGTASRGGLLSAVAALMSFGLFMILRLRKKMAAILLISVLVITCAWGVSQAKPLVYKLKLLRESRGVDIALQFRLSNWRDTFKMFLDFPIVGIGAGGFYKLFPLYKSMPEVSRVSQVRFSHAENEFLETLAEQGIVGTGLLLSIGTILWIQFNKRWPGVRSKTIRWLSLGAACALIGMVVHSLVDFPMHLPANMALFAVLGGLLARVGSGEEAFWNDPGVMNTSNRFVRFLSILLRIGFVISIFCVFTPRLWHQWVSEHYYLKAKEELDRMGEEGVISLPLARFSYEYLLKAKKVGADQARIYRDLGQVYVSFGLLTQKEKKKRNMWFQQAEASFAKALSLDPFDVDHHYGLGQLYEVWNNHEQAEPFLKRASLLEPQNPFYRFQFGKNQLELHKDESAHALFKETIRINGAYVEPVLKLLTSDGRVIVLEELQALLPQDEHRDEVRQNLAAFFDQHGELPMAEAIRQMV